MKAISYLLKSDYRFIFYFKRVKSIIMQDISFDLKDKVKMAIKDKKFQLISSRKGCQSR